eukprot:evm.model.scf_401.8 EVM.evm.TU.scf_401.8   scf_401:42858-46539(+)
MGVPSWHFGERIRGNENHLRMPGWFLKAPPGWSRHSWRGEPAIAGAQPRSEQRSSRCASVSSLMASPVADALLLMAEDFVASKCYLQAIQCLEALCSIDSFPVQRARAHLQLSRVLLEHTHNTVEARQHALTAELLVAGIRSCFHLKCEVLNHVGLCHKVLGDAKSERKAYQKALALCQASRPMADNSAVCEWACHFYAQLADVASNEGDFRAATAFLEKGLSTAKNAQIDHLQILFKIFESQLQLTKSNTSGCEALLAEIDSLLQLNATLLNETFTAQATIQVSVIRILLHLKVGRLADLTKDVAEDTPNGSSGSPGKPRRYPVVVKSMMAALEQLQDKEMAYVWLPWHAAFGVCSLLSAVLLKHVGKLKLAHECISSALSTVDGALAAIPIQLEAGEEALGSLAVHKGALYVVLMFLLLECKAQLWMLSSQMEDARVCIVKALTFVDKFPTICGNLRTSGHLLAGMYLYEVECPQDAIRHFNAVRELNGLSSENALSCVYTAFAELAKGDDDSLSRGIDALSKHHSKPNNESDALEHLIVNFGAAYMNLLQGHTVEAKTLLTRVLKPAHHGVGNHQLVCQLLNHMSAFQLEIGDIDGAQQMQISSLTLAKNSHDLPSQIGALAAMEDMYRKRRQEDKMKATIEYRQKKEKQLKEAVQKAAANNSQHLMIAGWNVS